jgi:hypothetical protein
MHAKATSPKQSGPFYSVAQTKIDFPKTRKSVVPR